MSPAIAKEIEADNNKIRLGDFLKVLERLEITVEEFLYLKISNNQHNPVNQIRSIESFIETQDLRNIINTLKSDSKFYYMLKCILAIKENDQVNTKKYAELVWFYLKDYDELYAYDLFCLTHIFMYFEGEYFKQITHKIRKDLKKWRDFQEFYKVEISFLLNEGRYLEEIDKYDQAIKSYEEAYHLAIERNAANLTGIAMYRIGYLNKDEDLLKKSKIVLEIFDSKLLTLLENDYKNRDI